MANVTFGPAGPRVLYAPAAELVASEARYYAALRRPAPSQIQREAVEIEWLIADLVALGVA